MLNSAQKDNVPVDCLQAFECVRAHAPVCVEVGKYFGHGENRQKKKKNEIQNKNQTLQDA